MGVPLMSVVGKKAENANSGTSIRALSATMRAVKLL